MSIGSAEDPRSLAEIATDELNRRLAREKNRLVDAIAGRTTISPGQIRELIGKYQAELRRRHD